MEQVIPLSHDPLSVLVAARPLSYRHGRKLKQDKDP